MSSRHEKLEHFDRFLQIIFETYAPDSIYIACNTLSVLFPDTKFSKNERISVQGIVETGVNRLVRDLGRFPHSMVAIFGTPTTIDEGTYARLLQQNGVEEERIVSQACLSLADTISEDHQGSSAKEKIETYVDEAVEKTKVSGSHHLTYLACTHYGYRKDYFSKAFEDRGIDTKVLNPNEFVIDDLFRNPENKNSGIQKKYGIEVEFITRYKIPKTALETITFFLEGVSPETVRAFTNYVHLPGLF
jgi:glutamate racemase